MKWLLFRKSFPEAIICRILPLLSSTICNIWGLTRRSLIHLELTWMKCYKCMSNFTLVHENMEFSQQQLLKGLSFIQCVFLVCLANIRCLLLHVKVLLIGSIDLHTHALFQFGELNETYLLRQEYLNFYRFKLIGFIS